MAFTTKGFLRKSWKREKSSFYLKNVSDKHIALHLPSGLLRIDRGRRVRIVSEAQELPEVQQFLQQGDLIIEEV